MTKDIQVKIKGTQQTVGAEPDEPVVLTTTGVHRVVGGRHHIRYDETIEGTTGNTRNHVAIGADRIEVHKKGQVETDLIFERGRTNTAAYRTQFGTLQMDVHTSKLDVIEREDRIDIRMEYDLSAGRQRISDCVMEMTFESV